MNILFRYLSILFFVFVAHISYACECDCAKDLVSHAIEHFEQDHKVQAIYAVADHGKIVLQGAEGFADLKKKKHLKGNEEMPLASGTKTFTAAAIFLLQDRGALNINDTVAKHLPAESGMWFNHKVPAWAHKVKISHLLSHSSGLHEYVFKFKMDASKTHDEVNKDLLHFIASEKLAFKPGSKFEYNNSGYVILGRIIEHVSGQKLADFMQKALFEPNNMKNTRVAGFEEALDFQHGRTHIFPTRYYVTPNGTKSPVYTPVGKEIIHVPNGDGGAISTTEDLIKWNVALHGGKVISQKSYNMMIKPRFKALSSGGYETYTGYGIYISKNHNNETIYHHEGRALGIRSDNGYILKKDVVYAIMSNAMVYIPKEYQDKIDLKNAENQLDLVYFRNAIVDSLK